MKRLIIIFIIIFVFNLAWYNAVFNAINKSHQQVMERLESVEHACSQN